MDGQQNTKSVLAKSNGSFQSHYSVKRVLIILTILESFLILLQVRYQLDILAKKCHAAFRL